MTNSFHFCTHPFSRASLNLGAGWPLKNLAATKTTIICLLIIVKNRRQLLASLAFRNKSLHLPMAVTPYPFLLDILMDVRTSWDIRPSWFWILLRCNLAIDHIPIIFTRVAQVSYFFLSDSNFNQQNFQQQPCNQEWVAKIVIDNKGISLTVNDLNNEHMPFVL